MNHRVNGASGRPKSRSPSAAYAFVRIRLVGFHNFVDETIEIGAGEPDLDGGHLFLLGDNGSGKTTVLDAIHLVLTGGESELNAAARSGPRAEGGRSLAGIVLRHHPERGTIRSGGGIAYAAIELRERASAQCIVIGVGLSATTLDAHVTRWGFVHRGRLDGVPLVQVVGGRRASTRDELREALGANAVLARIGDYRARVADMLFGGERGYEHARRIWAMAKSYRELAGKTRDFGALFEHFLPAPSSDVLLEITTSLRHIDELEQAARALEEQRAYVARVSECADEIRSLCAARGGLERDALQLRHAAIASEIVALDRSRDAVAQRMAETSLRLAEAEGRSARADASLAALRSGAGAALASELAAAERECDLRRADLERRRTALHAAQRERALAASTLEAADRALTLDAKEREAEARAAIEDASRLPWLLPRCADALRAGTDETSHLAALSELDAALTAAQAAHAQAEARLRDVTERPTTTNLVTRAEQPSGSRGLREALSRAGIAAELLCELIEPRQGASPFELAALEALLPSSTWETVVTSADDVTRAAVIGGEHALARLVVRAPPTPLPAWIDELLAPATVPLAHRARAALALELSQPDVLGPVARPSSVGATELRGVVVRAAPEPRLLGAAIRSAAEHARSTEIAESSALLARSVEEAKRTCDATLASVQRLARVVASMRALSSPHARRLITTRAERARDLSSADNILSQEALAVTSLDARRAEAEGALEALRAAHGAASSGAAALHKEIEALTDASREARAVRDTLLEERARHCASSTHLAEQRSDAAARWSIALSRLEQASGESGRVREDMTLAEIEQAIASSTQEERVRREELLGDGSRGLREPAGAGRFGLGLLGGDFPAELRIQDRRGTPIANVLAELERASEEASAIAEGKTRELFDVIIMGTLARQLQADVEGLHATVSALNELLGRAPIGITRYAFRLSPRADRAELVSLVRRMSVLDPSSRAELRAYVEGRRGELSASGDDAPRLLDYRRWFEYRLVTRPSSATDGEETTLTREVRSLGSGGEQGVPNHLVVLALAKLTFDAANARARPLLLDEAFQGIDASRREGLLGFATELGLQLVVASPDQDGVVSTTRSTTTLFVAKDEQGDVHLAPYHYWNRTGGTHQSELFERADASV